MKKIVSMIVLVISLFTLAACDSDEVGGNISPSKNYSEVLKLDFIAFGVEHRFITFSSDEIDRNVDEISTEDMEYLKSPLDSRVYDPILGPSLNGDDIVNLNILDEDQKLDFEYYTEQTKSNSFKIGFCVSNDTESANYGKQIIWITNLGWIDDKEFRDELGYNLFYESKILNLSDILDAAKVATQVDEFSQSFLNDDFTGIFLHNYINTEETTILKFYVMTLEERKVNLVKFDINIENR